MFTRPVKPNMIRWHAALADGVNHEPTGAMMLSHPLPRLVAHLALIIVFASRGPAAGARQTPSAFPDEWFFDGPQRPPTLKALEGKAAAALSIDSWIGSEVSLKDSKGKVVVVDFWATWCGPCMASIPHNVDIVKKYADQGFVFVGVHDSANGWDKAAQVVKDKGINYSVGVDKSGGASVKDYAVQFWPTYVAIDRKGIVRAAGLIPNRVEDVVKALLAESAPVGAAAAEAEFAADCYYGGAARPRACREMEGKSLPKFAGREWIGTAIEEGAWKRSVSVITFVSPTFGISLDELDKITPIAKELAAQGVLFAAVCDGRAAWEKMSERAKAKSLTLPIVRDSLVQQTGEDGKEVGASATAAGLGIEFWPTTIIADRTGRIRAAGVRADKIKTIVEALLAERAKE